jgi:hypothetical protein
MRLDSAKRKTLEKVAALALHANTGEQEWQASAIAFFRLLRNNNVSVRELLETPMDGVYRAPRYSSFGFGKYKGVRFEDVPSDYLQWALKNIKHLTPAARQAIREILSKEEFPFDF